LLVLHGIGSGGLMPDLTLLIEVAPERPRAVWPRAMSMARTGSAGVGRIITPASPPPSVAMPMPRPSVLHGSTGRGCRNHPCPHHGRREPGA
jgi:hypothetical protein